VVHGTAISLMMIARCANGQKGQKGQKGRKGREDGKGFAL
jgi:hypothetical protein